MSSVFIVIWVYFWDAFGAQQKHKQIPPHCLRACLALLSERVGVWYKGVHDELGSGDLPFVNSSMIPIFPVKRGSWSKHPLRHLWNVFCDKNLRFMRRFHCRAQTYLHTLRAQNRYYHWLWTESLKANTTQITCLWKNCLPWTESQSECELGERWYTALQRGGHGSILMGISSAC